MDGRLPTVSIIIVNFNGRTYLRDCLNSILNLRYPKKNYEVIVVDNGSSDGSVGYLKNTFPWVNTIALQTNEGFTGGNNVGIEQAKGDCVVLLNNDTVVTPRWLTELVAAANPPNVGIVSSKIFLSTEYAKVTLQSTTIQQSELDNSTNFSPRGVLLENVHIKSEKKTNNTVWYESGFKNEKKVNGISLRWSTGYSEIFLPLSQPENVFTFIFHGYPVDRGIDAKATLKLGKKVVVDTTLSACSVQAHTITIKKKDASSHTFQLIQNAGNVVLSNGYSKDRGSVLRLSLPEYLEFYERDSEFYEKPTKLVAACGAAMLIKKEVIEQIGKLDGHYFMYYEDIDFSLRAWRMGWDIAYAPKAKLFHIHRASSGKEETSFFIKMTEKNHLFLVFTHLKFSVCVSEYFLFLSRLVMATIRQFVFRFTKWHKYALWKTRASGRLEAFIAFHQQLPHLIWKRLWWQKRYLRSYKELEQLLY